jgi:hypothetical protein
MTNQPARNKVARDYGEGRLSHGAFAQYKFSVDGGAISNIEPIRTDTIPEGALITNCTTDTTTNLTSDGSATVQILLGTQEVVAADDFGDLDSPIQNTLTAPVKVTTQANIEITIATAALTAGVLNIYMEYKIPR